MTPMFGALLQWLDERLRLRPVTRQTANKIFPSHWSFLIGEVALISFGVLVASGIFLTFFYRASTDPIAYTGASVLYDGVELPAAFESIVRITHDVPGGLFMRRVHRGASHLFIASVVIHMLRVLLTGAFRRPRELNYVLGVGLLALVIAEGFLGYSLPYDSLAGTGIRIAYSEALSIPVVGDDVAFWVFGGEFPTGDVIPRFYALHVLVLPLALLGAVGAHLLLVFRQKHTQFPSPEVDGHRWIVGKPLWPTQVSESTTLVLVVGGLLAAAAVLVPWSDVTLLGPYEPGEVGNNAQPDWFLFWLEGMLRIFPALEFDLPGMTISGPFVAGALLPGLVFGFLLAYPFIERRWYRLEGDWHVLSNPLDIPLRAAWSLGTFSFVLILSAAATNDILSRMTGVHVEVITWTFRIAAVLVPPLLAAAMWSYSKRRLERSDAAVAQREEEATSRFTTGPGSSQSTLSRPDR